MTAPKSQKGLSRRLQKAQKGRKTNFKSRRRAEGRQPLPGCCLPHGRPARPGCGVSPSPDRSDHPPPMWRGAVLVCPTTHCGAILGTLRPLGYKYSPVRLTGLKTHSRAFYRHAVQGLPAVRSVRPFAGFCVRGGISVAPQGLHPF